MKKKVVTVKKKPSPISAAARRAKLRAIEEKAVGNTRKPKAKAKPKSQTKSAKRRRMDKDFWS